MDSIRGPVQPTKHNARTIAALTSNPGCARRRVLDAAGVVRTDFWGHEEPVVGKASNPAPAGWPAPGEPKYSLLGRVTKGAMYVANRGWYEASAWFPAVGTSDTRLPSPCLFYSGPFGPALQVAINDDNLGDNGGFADVTIHHWQS